MPRSRREARHAPRKCLRSGRLCRYSTRILEWVHMCRCAYLKHCKDQRIWHTRNKNTFKKLQKVRLSDAFDKSGTATNSGHWLQDWHRNKQWKTRIVQSRSNQNLDFGLMRLFDARSGCFISKLLLRRTSGRTKLLHYSIWHIGTVELVLDVLCWLNL